MLAIAARAVADGGRPGAGRARRPTVRVKSLESSSNDMLPLYTNYGWIGIRRGLVVAQPHVEHVEFDARHEL